MRVFLLTLAGVFAATAGAFAQNQTAEIQAGLADLVVLKDGELAKFESELKPQFYLVYHSASW